MVQFTLNGQTVRSTAHNNTPLLNVLANAVFDATGVRFRRLPLTPERVKQGLDKKGIA